MFESEERRIAERIKEYIKNNVPYDFPYIMLRDGNIMELEDYFKMIRRGKINPNDAYVYIWKDTIQSKPFFYYPFLVRYKAILSAYLSRLAFRSFNYAIAPATGLKYIVSAKCYIVNFFGNHENYLSIELTNLNTAANNTNLYKIVFEVVGTKLVSGEKKLEDKEYEKIRDIYKSQKLFAGHDFEEAYNIIRDYYYEGNKLLIKEVVRIAMDYDRIFQPYRACYDMDSWKEIECSLAKF